MMEQAVLLRLSPAITVTITSSTATASAIQNDHPYSLALNSNPSAKTEATTPPRDATLGSGQPIVDVEGLLNQQSVGGFRKIDSPPVPLHVPIDPVYAEREITIDPYPPLAGEPTELCVVLRNPPSFTQDVTVQFSWASFGIGLPFTPINGAIPVSLPPYSVVRQCIHWVPPISGHLCLQVMLEAEGYAPQVSQRNMDVNEPLQPGVAHALTFPVGNPTQQFARGKTFRGRSSTGPDVRTSGRETERLESNQDGQLLDEISGAIKNGQGPGEAALMPLLGGLGISPN